MILSEKHNETLISLLKVEHRAQAERLNFIPKTNTIIENDLLIKSVSLLDDISRVDNERARKIVVLSSAILWSYRDSSWDGLKEFLILILTRVGFPPAAIMIDSGYNNAKGEFSGMKSLINELSVTINQLAHEIYIGDSKFLITGFQKRVWEKLKILKLVGISAPTSAGKSYIILLKGIEVLLEERGNVIYIVPTLSLVAQVSADFNQLLNKFGIGDIRVSTTYFPQKKSENKIYVLTQEKAISAFTQEDIPFENVRLLVVDEIQNIERVSNEEDQRAKTLYDTLIEFRHTCMPDLTILSGPRVEGLKEFGVDVFNQQSTVEVNTKDSPVASITYSISKIKNQFFFNQYTDLISVPFKILITNDSKIAKFGRARYQDEFLDYLSDFVENLGSDSCNIIFSPTSPQARKTALKLAQRSSNLVENPLRESLVNYIKETVHENYDMCTSIPKGFVYHSSKVPSHIRSVVERSIKDQIVHNVICTTTLMQGINLPAQNVILRNPDLSINSIDGVKPKLTEYEIANLRGRAGRLLKDFIGRTFILEENSFNQKDQLNMFPEAEKHIKAGYGEKYNEFKKYINSDLLHNSPPSEISKEFNYLTTYIRQMILKYGKMASERLSSVGITIKPSFIKEVSFKLSLLNVPNVICFKNRYWDPLDLDRLYSMRNDFNLPISISEFRVEHLLENSLKLMKRSFPHYFSKYFDNNVNLLSASISAKEWMKEKPLKLILSDSYFKNSDNIEKKIALLQNKISYGIPMLLKPIYDIKYPDNMFLKFIEIGAYLPITRKMIELNIPRETAIYLNQHYFKTMDSNIEDIEQIIIESLREIKESLDYWRKVQIEGIV